MPKKRMVKEMSQNGERFQKRRHSPQKTPQNERTRIRPEREDIERARIIREGLLEDATNFGFEKPRERETEVDLIKKINTPSTNGKVKINIKQTFGALGEGVIQISVKGRELQNKSNWIVAFDHYGELQIFQTKELAAYVKRCWGAISKKAQQSKSGFFKTPIRLSDFYAQMRVTPIKVNSLNPERKPAGKSQSSGESYRERFYTAFKRVEKLTYVTKKTIPIPVPAPNRARAFERNKRLLPANFLRTTQSDRRGLLQTRMPGTMRRGR